MKKIYSLLIVLFALVSLQTKAQLACTATFTTQFLNGSTVKFIPSPLTLDSPNVYHYWNFNDGGSSSLSVSPTHTFPTGTFQVIHYVTRYTPNFNIVCRDSSIQQITIVQGACLLWADFQSYVYNSNPLEKIFSNQSNYAAATDSIRWTFGDGISSNQYYTSHIYANPGIYNVCLRIIKRNIDGTLSNCISEKCKLDTVGSLPCNIQAFFTNTPDSATAPATIQFTNQTVNFNPTDSITWSFGDGTANSYAVNPSHIYTTPGIYTVCIRVKRNTTQAGTPACIREFCKQITITGPPTCNLLANFTWYRDSLITIPNSYHFTNTTTPLAATDSIRWSFGDGTFSNQVNPTHAYTTAGTYNVCLRVIKRNPNGVLTNCISEKCYSIVVAPINVCNLQAYFTNTTDSLQQNIIHFTNQSPGFASADSITWIFGDGTTSNQISPSHTYTTAGTYTVCLRVKKNNTSGSTPCISIFCKVVVITLPCNLTANFTWYRDSIPTVALNTYHFINTSTPLAANDSIRWTFGDGTSSSQANPIHVYAQPGTYVVCLRVIKRDPSGALTNCVSEKCYTIIITQICNLVANYAPYTDPTNTLHITFTNNTVGTLTNATALWSFGDGSTATTWNATHTYTQPGRYYICLRVQYGACISYRCDSITVYPPIIVPSCSQLSAYSHSIANNVVVFAPYANIANVQYTWTFGDGTGIVSVSATHTYATQGNYTACLTAFKDNNCASTTCKNIYIAPNCNNITLSIGDVRDSLVPNRIKFTALSNTTTTNQQWTITKIPTTATTGTITINSNNPTYMFLDSGYYNVCVKATYANGCIKTICKTIHITQNMPGTNVCTLQAYPNPATSIVNATVTLVQPQLINSSIYNSQNVLVAQSQQQGVVGINTISFNIATLPAGIYTIRVMYGGQVCYAQFIK